MIRINKKLSESGFTGFKIFTGLRRKVREKGELEMDDGQWMMDDGGR